MTLSRTELIEKYREDLRGVDRTLRKADHYASEHFEQMEEARRCYERWLETQQEYTEKREVLVTTLVELGIPEWEIDDED